ncbi:hypothetical protein SAMN05660209_00125 [Geodermatophilus africanus]|uniref:Uncharacterized protein n=1 Tax=Geodermatophilus africanus TaxID=1137993 RepID=A0A1H3API8_9ACTN|nr:hypothetical protein SAMN05660209_00125 [Geodermatophilus africanus]
MVLAAHELPDPGGIGSSAVAAPPGAGAVALALPAVVLLLTAWSTRHGRRTGALVALAASSAVGYLAAGTVVGRGRSGTTDGGAPPHLLVLAVLLLAATVAVAAWRALPAGAVTLERRTRVLVGPLLLAAVWGLLMARQLPVGPVAGGLPVRSAGALADLVVLPAAAAAGGGLLARAAWAGKATFASAGCLALAGLVPVGAVWSPTPPGGAGASAAVTWTATALGVAAAVPAVLCWTAVVRTGRQYWGGLPAAAPAPRPRLLPVPRSSPEDPASRPTPGAAAVAARGARRSGT